ncbi:MAG: type II toxin-antitoxin system RelE/ParE family toxin [Cyanobacteria bacterium HKST-UBA02]|nr:type II toxin-antitoxin system RelE/ParE family toxin [Cyanobacteria bacterium HKST-UBA02]
MVWKIEYGASGSFWRYRVGDYRVICDIKDNEVTVLVVRIGHRSDAYES